MTPELDAIGKSRLGNRARMCKGWRYMPGMLLTDGTRLCSYSGRLEWTGIHDSSKVRVGGGIPDLTDPATLGCLLALVREAWMYPSANVEEMFTRGAGWLAYTNNEVDRDNRFYGASDAEALVAALEATP